MKKQTAMVLSFSALLAIGAIAPHVIWQADQDAYRSPASVEQKDFFSNKENKTLIEGLTKKDEKKNKTDKLLDNLAADTKKKEEEAAKKKKEKDEEKNKEDKKLQAQIDETPLKELEKVEIKSLEVKSVEVEAQISCLKEAQPADLEAQIKKLVEDKEAVVKELAELKKSKKDDKEDKNADKKEDKKEKKIVKNENTEDVLGIMSQLTSLMISQQQQQMLMMTQMFSMFQAQQPRQQSRYAGFSPLSDYMSPYAFNASSFQFPGNESPYSLSGFNNRVGLNSDFSNPYNNYYDRTPASQRDFGPMFDRGILDSSVEGSTFQPQILTPKPHNGFNFGQGTNAMDMQRIQF